MKQQTGRARFLRPQVEALEQRNPPVSFGLGMAVPFADLFHPIPNDSLDASTRPARMYRGGV